jgi:hypothetical protein
MKDYDPQSDSVEGQSEISYLSFSRNVVSLSLSLSHTHTHTHTVQWNRDVEGSLDL